VKSPKTVRCGVSNIKPELLNSGLNMRILRLLALFSLLLAIVFFVSYPGFRSLPVGIWVDETPTGPMRQVRVRRAGAQVFVQTWAACGAGHCNWGEEVAKLHNGVEAVTFDAGYKTTQLQFVAQLDGRLRVTYESNFGRQPHAVQFLSRWNLRNDDASDAAASVILHQVAERHRTLPPAYFEQVINNTTYVKTYYLPPNKMREEITSKDLSTVHISDGEFHWQRDTATNKYSRYPDKMNPWSTFTDLSEIAAGTSRIIGHELLYGVPCTVILFNTIYGDRLQYWIEDERHLVRQVKTPNGNMTCPVIRLNDAMKPDLFKYDPKVTNAGRIHFGAHFKLQSR
jgi:hypothetical protein